MTPLETALGVSLVGIASIAFALFAKRATLDRMLAITSAVLFGAGAAALSSFAPREAAPFILLASVAALEESGRRLAAAAVAITALVVASALEYPAPAAAIVTFVGVVFLRTRLTTLSRRDAVPLAAVLASIVLLPFATWSLAPASAARAIFVPALLVAIVALVGKGGSASRSRVLALNSVLVPIALAGTLWANSSYGWLEAANAAGRIAIGAAILVVVALSGIVAVGFAVSLTTDHGARDWIIAAFLAIPVGVLVGSDLGDSAKLVGLFVASLAFGFGLWTLTRTLRPWRASVLR